MYEGCIGVKTGFTKATGRCLVSAAERRGMRLICVTLNAPDDWRDHKFLFDSVLESFSPQKIVSSGEILSNIKVKNAEKDSLALFSQADLYIPLKKGEEPQITIKFEPYEDISAPIKSGDVLGRIVVKLKKTPLGEFPLVSNEDIAVKKPSLRHKATFSYNLKRLFFAWVTCFR